ncbi:hypothetical protein Cni_G09347 [Canna indica]|uniref:RNase H type-1 domain-containing protein n=1 Tax=Canna indica TaxID=4628 RepID=A0AAQ3K3T9_9LILI|nr:hypothetical protein Cni_G09347 [Canna indica]
MEELRILEDIDSKGLCNDNDLLRLNCLNNKIMALNRQIHIKWWSKSRAKWLEQNDKNTRYFHNLTKFRQRWNFIYEIMMDDRVISNPQDIVNCFANHYKNLWDEDISQDIFVNQFKHLKWKRIPNNAMYALTKNFSQEEISFALNSMGKGKAPDLDGFGVELYINYWDCQTAINILNQKLKAPWYLKDLVTDIRNVATITNVFSWFHIKRSANIRAHNLAKHGLSSVVAANESYRQSFNRQGTVGFSQKATVESKVVAIDNSDDNSNSNNAIVQEAS